MADLATVEEAGEVAVCGEAFEAASGHVVGLDLSCIHASKARSKSPTAVISRLLLEDVAALGHPELWESDEEYEDFLTDLYASRRAGAS